MSRFPAVSVLALVLVAAFAFAPAAPAAAAYPDGNFSWTAVDTGVDGTLFDVDASDAKHAWAVGAGGRILFWDGEGWRGQASGTTTAIESVSATDAGHAWAVTVLGDALFHDGGAWEWRDPQPGLAAPDRSYLYGVYALDESHVWAVGTHSTICFYDGSGWTARRFAAGTDYSLKSIWAADEDHVWAVGERGKVLHWDGMAWSEQASGTDSNLHCVDGLRLEDVLACGDDGVMLHYDSLSGWTRVESGTNEDIRGISLADERHAWAADGRGGIHFYNGSSWERVSSGERMLEDVFALDPETAWAVGWSGTLLEGRAVPPVPTTRRWGHDSIGATVGDDRWYLAEGSTLDGFETWILVQNPNHEPARVELTYMTAGGPVEGPSANIPAGSRRTFDVRDVVDGEAGVSTEVVSDRPVIVERAMYGNGRRWGHDSIGANADGHRWYLAEGCTAHGFETWVLVSNPGDAEADVELTFMTPSGPVEGPRRRLAPRSRATFDVSDTVPAAWEVSTFVSSNVPVVVERAMYGEGRAWGHCSIGTRDSAESWFLAEGCTTGGFETWILVQNPGPAAAEVNLTYMTAAGPVSGPRAIIQPDTRRTFNVADVVPGAWEVSTRVDSLQPVIAERAMYGEGRAWGHDSIGAVAPDDEWYLAEGCTAPGYETWILVQNQDAADASVEIVYMTDSGSVSGPTVTVPGSSRASFNVFETVGVQWEVSTYVRSDRPVVVERAVYGDSL